MNLKAGLCNLALLFLAVIVLAAGCTSINTSDKTTTQETATVQRGNITINISASGNLAATTDQSLTFYSSGTVEQVMVNIGDHVKAGDALAKLATADLASNLATKRISVIQAQMDLESAESPTTNSSGTQVTAAPDPLKIEMKELSLQNAKDNLAEAEKQLKLATITAPFDGLIMEVNVKAGDQVTATTKSIRIIDPLNWQTRVYVSESEISQIAIGTPATVQLVAISGVTFPASVSAIAETATITSNIVSYQTTVKLDPLESETVTPKTSARSFAGFASRHNSTTSDNISSDARPNSGNNTSSTTSARNYRVREGLTSTVNIIADQRTNVLLIPSSAIASSGGRYFVQTPIDDGTVNRKMIEAGVTDGSDTEIISGLNEGETVILLSSTTTSSSSTSSNRTSRQAGVNMGMITGGGGPPPGGGMPSSR